ncbi:adipokinetic hormone/corazonin-related peptide receptor variant I-like [Schistocerca cancellata]|uniref:adipokinetic hormone/corazonin-related peptide receptor variant I-like n=1 Tax=Schistocerca cancellata TaxID=274614 RepID=UPI002118478B|nr:adipokinetic hormone/corazonin-related peptide receptor variant I-like [Schistocerca cancellata]
MFGEDPATRTLEMAQTLHTGESAVWRVVREHQLQVGWRLTTQWVAGDAACKVFLLLRAFGLYLSSNVLVCVSLDRYFAVLHPLKVNDARRRGKVMLVFAWLIAFACSVPQVRVRAVQ